MIDLFIFGLDQRYNISFKYLPMEPKENKQLKELLDQVIAAMTECMQEESVRYKIRDIKKCAEIMHVFLEEISATNDKSAGMTVIKNTIEPINQLHKSSRKQLIGTMEREDLCEIINTACVMKGYANEKEDVTQEWREW